MNELIRIETREETMTSTQLAEMLHMEKKHVHAEIKKMFKDKIDGRIIRPSKDSRGYVMEYHMPELESKMFVARKDINYLEKITKFWIDKNKEDAQATATILIPEQRHAIRLQNIREQMNLLNELCSLDDRDRMDLSDAVRNTGQHLLPARTDVALPVTISGRAIDLGIKLDRKDAIRVGKITAKLYREKHDKNPVKHTQYVDGAARHVNSYTEDDLDIIDEAINGIF